MQNRLLPVTILITLLFGATNASAQEYLLRYEAIHYATLTEIVQHHIVRERVTPDNLGIAVFEYRLDRKGENGSLRDSSSLGNGTFALNQFNPDSLSAYREALVNSPTAKVLKDHQLEYLGRVDTIAGLPSYMYAITVESVRQYLVWLAPAPAGLENLNLWQSLEYPKRKISFLVEEELCNMIRLVLLRGWVFPPDAKEKTTAFIITRFDTAVNIDLLTVRNNTYLYELKSVAAVVSSGK